MTSIALDVEHYVPARRQPAADTVDDNHLGLMIAIVAPLSAGFWGFVGWSVYRLSALAFG